MDKYDVFLSHNSADKSDVRKLAVQLRARGIECWLDEWHLRPGDTWQKKIEAALKDCATCAVFLGPSGIGSWQDREMRTALLRQVKQDVRLVPVFLPGAQPGEASEPLEHLTWVTFRTLDDPEAFEKLVWGITGTQPEATVTDTPTTVASPYRALKSFDVADAPFFFGRNKMTDQVLDRLRALGDSRFWALIGPSGSGKSSLAKAGVLAGLKGGKIEGSESWPVAICLPGAQPLKFLAAALPGADSGDPSLTETGERIAEMGKEHGALDLAVHLILRRAPPERRLVVFVDQLEEVFSGGCEEAERQAFLGNLSHAATAPGGKVLVLVTLRADFYGHFAPYPKFWRLLAGSHEPIGPMDSEDLLQAINGPAEEVSCSLEPGLADRLLKDLKGQPGDLPLLQFALSELWDRRSGNRLTHQAYKTIGGIEGALQRKAEEKFDKLVDGDKEVCREIFLRLTQPVDGGLDTRRRASKEEILACGAGAEGVLKILVEARLLVAEGGAEGATVEVAHEVLIQEWPHLRKWVEERRNELIHRRDLSEQARRWEAYGREESYLYQGAELDNAKKWLHASREAPGRLEQEFLASSFALQDREAQREAARRRADRIKRYVIVTAISLIAIGSSYVALREEERGLATSALLQARAGLETGPQRALLLGLETWRRAEDEPLLAKQAEDIARQALARLGGRPLARFPAAGHLVSVDSTGTRLAAASADGHLGVWPLFSGSRPLLLTTTDTDLHELVLSPGGRWLAAVGKDHVIRLWDLANTQAKPRLLSHENALTAVFPTRLAKTSYVAFSQGERWIATRATDEPVKVWSLERAASGAQALAQVRVVEVAGFGGDRYLAIGSSVGAEVCELTVGAAPRCSAVYRGRVLSLTFRRASEASFELLIAAEGQLKRAWDSSSPRAAANLGSCRSPLLSLTLAPDDRWLVARAEDEDSCLWDLRTPAPTFVPLGCTKTVAFRADSGALFVRDCVGRIVRWDLVDRPAGPFELLSEGKVIQNVTADPRGRRLAATHESQIFLWDKNTHDPVILPTPDGGVDYMAFTAAGWLVTGVDGEAPRLMNPGGRNLPASAEPGVSQWSGPVEAIAFTSGRPAKAEPPRQEVFGPGVSAVARSGNGRWLAEGNEDGSCSLRDQRPGGQRNPLRNHKGGAHAVAFSPDSCWLATAGEDAKIRLWKLCPQSLARNPKVLYLDGPVEKVEFDPHNRWLVSIGGNLTYLYSLIDRDAPQLLPGQVGKVRALAFSPDGQRLATGGEDGFVRLWDLAGEELRSAPLSLPMPPSLPQPRQAVLAVAFDRQGKHLATGDAGGKLVTWKLDMEELSSAGCAAAGRDLTRTEWRQIAGWWPLYRQTCKDRVAARRPP